ncbi:hypothetical protein [Pseudoalteromonas ruthenica]|uniref:Uncharacterized protein n=1 Tax=Pseudoalteromonas ruthenica TaxID=151081 RepID=A0A0F4Q3D8_9GAMM|nr:hypothetical protein [Pseudoalteromonas ruthenica]KJY98096.1 hypothetical protein TW76_06075 [Pseudoalteromonas ruthenica]KJZ02163.1 hypothetical protein TW72_00285 [Pseudoalteromonas ruthenica]TMO90303.1 hypothetical protein CWC12_00540 [Pseudoalteromonas ruthenica]TMO91989.1 hypothetical protein CWC13_11955 [Pseudoalteromonas ruthenica]TMO99628.1 hypothetical protein CWC07_07725 [Pseudoalteromonas ruthenica]
MSIEGFVHLMFIVFMPLFLLMTALFHRVSAAYISKGMESEGVLPPSWDICYGYFFKRWRGPTFMFDGRLVPKYARTVDKVLACIYLFSTLGFGIALILAAYFDVYQ